MEPAALGLAEVIAAAALPDAPGGPRPIRDHPGCEADAAAAAALMACVDGVMRAGAAPKSMRTDYPLVWAPENLRNCFAVVAAGGGVVAESPYLPRMQRRASGAALRMAVVAATATRPEFRRRGLASACLAASLLQQERDEIALSWLDTEVETFHVYEQLGFAAIADGCFEYALHKTDAARFGALPTGLLLEELEPGELAEREALDQWSSNGDDLLAELHALHADEGATAEGGAEGGAAAEGSGEGGAAAAGGAALFERSLADTRALLGLPGMRLLLARRAGVDGGGGAAVAYLVCSTQYNRPGLVEGGGAPDALRALVGHALATWGGEWHSGTGIGSPHAAAAGEGSGGGEAFVACASWAEGGGARAGYTFEPGPHGLGYYRKPLDAVVQGYGYAEVTALGSLLEEACPERRRAWGPSQMVRVNSPRRLLDALAPELLCRGHPMGAVGRLEFSVDVTDVPEAQGGGVISLARDPDDAKGDLPVRRVVGNVRQALHACVTRRELAQLVFGAHPERRWAADALPGWAHWALRCPTNFFVWQLDTA
jgi:GNAT superfamily N-acetyltransferase